MAKNLLGYFLFFKKIIGQGLFQSIEKNGKKKKI